MLYEQLGTKNNIRLDTRRLIQSRISEVSSRNMNKIYLYGAGILTASAGVFVMYFQINSYLDAIEEARAKMAEEKERRREKYILILKSAGVTMAVSTLAFLGYKLKKFISNIMNE